jgi:NAD(P)-dependent dehydrogenase (short-subunit alcohol dehydrogenase family)
VLVDIPASGDHLAAVANVVHGTALQLDISRADAGPRILEHALQQGGLPSDVAEAIAFLASDAAGGINGDILRVCGQNLVGA